MAFRFDLPDVDDAYALADWIEIMMLLTQKSQISKAHLQETLSAHLGVSPQELETPISFLYAEISRRRYIAGCEYPLIVEDVLIKLDTEANVEMYKFLLLISLEGPMRLEKRYKEIDKLFDDLAGAAIRQYLGEGSKSLRFGWPVSGGRPTKFKDAIEWLSVQVGIPVGNGNHASTTKDGGVDVVAWKPFEDHMTAFMIIYVQCTVQRDWFPKSKDIIDRVWLSRLDTGGWAITALAIPFIIPKNCENWDELRRTVGLIFDRLRLTCMLRGCDPAQFTEIKKWNKKELAKYALNFK